MSLTQCIYKQFQTYCFKDYKLYFGNTIYFGLQILVLEFEITMTKIYVRNIATTFFIVDHIIS